MKNRADPMNRNHYIRIIANSMLCQSLDAAVVSGFREELRALKRDPIAMVMKSVATVRQR